VATKLKNLHLKKVDIVQAGANQHADIALFKGAGDIRTDDGLEELFKKFGQFLAGEGYAPDAVRKQAVSFAENMNAISYEQIDDEIWYVLHALRNSFSSILTDVSSDAGKKTGAMAESLGQFATAVGRYIPAWCSGRIAGVRGPVQEEATEPIPPVSKSTFEAEGEVEEMAKIDVSRMTPQERETYDELVRKYAAGNPVEKAGAVPEEDPEGEVAGAEEDEDEAEKCRTKKGVPGVAKSAGMDEVYKGMIAELRAEVAKMKDDALTREVEKAAGRYEVLGKKKDDLVPLLKSLKAAGNGAYEEVVALLDDMVAAQEASGVFGEIGKSGGGDSSVSAVAKAKAAALELQKANPSLSDAQALDRVLLADPELRKEFDT
jgi:hypothetical protein